MGVLKISDLSYEEIVKSYFKEKSETVFPNSCEDHARIIIQQIFENAKNYVDVLAHNLKKSLWDSQTITEAVQNAVARGVVVRFAIQENVPVSESLSEWLCANGIKIATNVASQGKHNFIVSDNRMFRYEDNYEEIKAVASANSPELAEILREYYNEITA